LRELKLSEHDVNEAAKNAEEINPEDLHQVDASADQNESKKKNKPNQADTIIRLVEESGAVLFHDERGNGYGRIPVDDHQEVWALKSRAVRRWLACLIWSDEGKSPGAEAIQSALNILEAKAFFDGSEHTLSVRVARLGDDVWIDLADKSWRAIQIHSGGWDVVENPPIIFRRFSHQKPLPLPERGGDPKRLLDFLSIQREADRLLLLVFCVTALIPGFPHPVLIVQGVHGSAKSTLFAILKALLDPSVLDLQSPSDSPREFVQQASHHWLLFLDNLSSLPSWLSDAICRCATGGSFSKRELYTDDEDIIYNIQNIVGLNGINMVATRADLLDRALILSMDPIPQDRRREKSEVWKEFERDRPRILGGLLDAASAAIREYPNVQLPHLYRMADFIRWGEAVARVLGYSESEFLSAYEMNVGRQNEEALEASPVAQAIQQFMKEKDSWEGAPSELLGELNVIADQVQLDTRSKYWPKSPNWLTRRINEVRPNLMATGISVDEGKGTERRIILTKSGDMSSLPSLSSIPTPEKGQGPGDTREDTAGPIPLEFKSPDSKDSKDGISRTSPDDECKTQWEEIL
jgi:hypothetical protein